jgi:hypothetical protein
MKNLAVRTTEVEHDLNNTSYYVMVGKKELWTRITKEEYDRINAILAEQAIMEFNLHMAVIDLFVLDMVAARVNKDQDSFTVLSTEGQSFTFNREEANER